MDEEIRKGFEQAIAHRKTKDEDARRTAQQEADRVQSIEYEWTNKRDQIAAPALREIELMLKQSGWVTNIVVGDKGAGAISLEVYRGNMRAAVGSGRPNIAFSLDVAKRAITVYLATVSMGSSTGSLELATLSAKDIQKAALEFFQRLAGERPREDEFVVR